MHITASKKKQEYKKDPLADALARIDRTIRSHSRFFITLATVVVLVVIGFFAYQSIKASTMNKAQKAFGSAMFTARTMGLDSAAVQLERVTNSYGNTPYAAYCAFLLAKKALGDGGYTEALDWLRIAEKEMPAGIFLNGAVAEGMGTCYEQLGRTDEALKAYSRARDVPTYAYRRASVEYKMALLQYTMQNYDDASRHCRAVMSDTLNTTLRQDAKNLLVEMREKSGS